MTTTAPPTAAGPSSYRNWRAHGTGAQSFGAQEVPFYSDSHITGEGMEGLGPYHFINGIPADERDPALVLTFESHLDPDERPAMDKKNVETFTGAWLADELAALLSLSLGVRVMAGGVTRWLHDRNGKRRWVINGDRDRPMFFPSARAGEQAVLPRVVRKNVSFDADMLATLPMLEAPAATALVRAARSYRDAVWVAEMEPDLAWLLLVSALEAAAVHHNVEETTLVEILRRSKPALVERLEAVDSSLVEDVAAALSRELRATGRFIDFMRRFMPEPPDKRPPDDSRVDWSSAHLKKCMQKVYEHRSAALHESIPFPTPMCDPPRWFGSRWEAPMETVPGLAFATLGGVWTSADLPFSLHTFEYIARGALLSWWRSLVPRDASTAVEAPSSPE